MNIILSIFAESTPTVSTWAAWKDILMPILSAAIGAFFTYLVTRSKNQSEVGKIDAETLKTYLQIIKDIQENNQSLYEKLQVLRAKVDSVDDMLDKAQDDLERVQKELKECMDASDRIDEAVSITTNSS